MQGAHWGLLSFPWLTQRCPTEGQLCIPALPRALEPFTSPFLLQLLCEHIYKLTLTNSHLQIHIYKAQVCPGGSSSLPQPRAEQGLGSKVGKKLNKCLNITEQELWGVCSLLWCLPTPSSCSPSLHLALSLIPASSKLCW